MNENSRSKKSGFECLGLWSLFPTTLDEIDELLADDRWPDGLQSLSKKLEKKFGADYEKRLSEVISQAKRQAEGVIDHVLDALQKRLRGKRVYLERPKRNARSDAWEGRLSLFDGKQRPRTTGNKPSKLSCSLQCGANISTGSRPTGASNVDALYLSTWLWARGGRLAAREIAEYLKKQGIETHLPGKFGFSDWESGTIVMNAAIMLANKDLSVDIETPLKNVIEPFTKLRDEDYSEIFKTVKKCSTATKKKRVVPA